MWTDNTSGAWPLVRFTAPTIVCIYGCILTPAFFFLSMPCKVYGVFAEIRPVPELEPTRELAGDVCEWAPFSYGMEHLH